MRAESRIEALDEFVKGFHDTVWYVHGDHWYRGEFHPPFDTDVVMLGNTSQKIASLNRTQFKYSEFIPWETEVTENNIADLFDQCAAFAVWWMDITKAEVSKAVKRGIRQKTILTEEDARNVAMKFLTDTIEPYQITTYISNLLPRKVAEIYEQKKIKHPYFKGKATITLYKDIWGRVWSKGVGSLKEGIPTRLSGFDNKHRIETLGGGVWSSKNNKRFVCEYRTSLEEHQERTRPETFIG